MLVIDVIDKAVVPGPVLGEGVNQLLHAGVRKVEVNPAPVTFGDVEEEDGGIGNIAEEEGERKEYEEEDELVFAPTTDMVQNIFKIFDHDSLCFGHLCVDGRSGK